MGGGARNYWTQIAIQDREVRVIRMSDLRLALGIIAVLVVATLQEARPEDEGSSVNIAAIQERIHKHIEGRNLEALEKLGLEIEKQWRATNPVLYARATLMLCRAMSSKRLGSKRQYGISQFLGMRALEVAEKATLEVECGLVRQLLRPVDRSGAAVKKEAWAALRQEQAKKWLHAWRRVETAIDEDWDPDDLPLKNVRPPLGIRDPDRAKEARVKYKAAVKANNEKARKYGEQLTARELRKTFVPTAEKYLVYAYKSAPPARDELTQLLDEYDVEAKAKTRILKAVPDDSGS